MKFQSICRNTSIASAMLLLALTISGCGDGLSGHKYAEQGGQGESIEFMPGNKVNIVWGGFSVAGTYSVDGNQITINTSGDPPWGMFVVTKQSDGSITGLHPFNATVVKVQ
jgi:hypothetical protein